MEDNRDKSEVTSGLAWKEEFCLGHDWVDAQHRKLFELVSGLVEACSDGSDLIRLKGTLDFLVNYTVQHFDDEEALQLKCNYPGYERHKRLHDDFKATVGGLVEKFTMGGSSTELSSDVNKIVVRWLVNHIQREDKKIGQHIKNLAAEK
ncbi:MAG: hemerythrin family protein [Acidobacteriota bacterium]|jgi:hemerythrin|nr:hemerythrin family protein [Acidobacteriota bacterium]